MKLLLLVATLLFTVNFANAQNAVEKEIRKLDELEAQATIGGDTITLNHLWSPNYVVNNPANTVVDVAQIRQLMKAGKIAYLKFSQVVEKVTINSNVVVTMGYEVNQPENATDHPGKIVTRRYTNVWLKGKIGWQIIARQATIINVQ